MDRSVAPGAFASVYAVAQSGDVLKLQPGLHNLGTSKFSFSKSGITVEAASGWTPGQWVTGTNGHNIANVPVRFRCNMDLSGSDNTFRGFAWYAPSVDFTGTCTVKGSNNKFEDLVCRNRFTSAFVDGSVSTTAAGSIFFNILNTASRPTGNQWRRIRWRLNGDPNRNDHDHPLYFGNALNSVVEDCISYEQPDGWFLHFYTNGDGNIVRRCVAYNVSGGVTFSGGTEPTTGCQASDNNIVENTILVGATRRYLLESYWGCGVVGVGNIIRNCDVYQPAGFPSNRRISTAGGGFTQQNILNSDPLFADPANGNFTLSSSSPALGMGPTQIQPGGSPPSPPLSPTFATPVPGDTEIGLSWTNPAAGTFTEVVIRRGTTSYPTLSSGTEVYRGTDTTHTDTGLTNDTTYRYSGWSHKDGVYSLTPTQTLATPAEDPDDPPPPPPDPTGGNEHFGKTTVGGTWRGMSPDYKRASRYSVPAGKQITAIVAYLRGNGTSGTQTIRAFAYDDATGALLGTCTAQDVSNTLSEQWVTFTASSPFECPSNGGVVRLGLHTTSGDVQVATAIVTGALAHGADTYSDGTAATWTNPEADQYELSIFALIEDVALSTELSASATFTFSSSARATETPAKTPVSDVAYRMVTHTRTFTIPTPFQVSTGAEVEWDGNNFVPKE